MPRLRFEGERAAIAHVAIPTGRVRTASGIVKAERHGSKVRVKIKGKRYDLHKLLARATYGIHTQPKEGIHGWPHEGWIPVSEEMLDESKPAPEPSLAVKLWLKLDRTTLHLLDVDPHNLNRI